MCQESCRHLRVNGPLGSDGKWVLLKGSCIILRWKLNMTWKRWVPWELERVVVDFHYKESEPVARSVDCMYTHTCPTSAPVVLSFTKEQKQHHLNYIIRQSQKAPGHLIHGTCPVDNDNLLQCPGFISQPLQMLMINNVIMMGKVPGPVVGLI